MKTNPLSLKTMQQPIIKPLRRFSENWGRKSFNNDNKYPKNFQMRFLKFASFVKKCKNSRCWTHSINTKNYAVTYNQTLEWVHWNLGLLKLEKCQKSSKKHWKCLNLRVFSERLFTRGRGHRGAIGDGNSRVRGNSAVGSEQRGGHQPLRRSVVRQYPRCGGVELHLGADGEGGGLSSRGVGATARWGGGGEGNSGGVFNL